MRKRPKILLVDGHRVYRQGLRTLLESSGFVECVGETDSIEGLLHDFPDVRADVVLLELEVGGNDIGAIVEACESVHDAVILTYDHLDRKSVEVDEVVLEAFLAGSVGHVADASDPASFAEAISLALHGMCVMESRLKQAVFARLNSSTQDTMRRRHSASLRLTERELDVIRRVADGCTNAQIASDLGVSERTVKNHLGRVFVKLHVSSRGQAAAVAVKRHLI